MKRKCSDRKGKTCARRRGSSRDSARASASRRCHLGTPQVARRPERRAQGEAEIDGLLARVALLRQMREGAERLLEIPHRLAVGRPRHGLLPCLPQYARALSHTSPRRGMVGQALDLLSHSLSGERLEGLDNPDMQSPPPLLQEAFVGHLLGEGVLEGILELGKEACLVEEFRGLQSG